QSAPHALRGLDRGNRLQPSLFRRRCLRCRQSLGLQGEHRSGGRAAARRRRPCNSGVQVSSSAPVGVFDSGMGGLTVVREMISQLPNESIIYFGDTARVPSGPKSPDTLLRYSREITSYLTCEGVNTL